MTSITYVGMDVHTTNFTLCCYTVEEDQPFALVQVKPECGEILKYLDRIRIQRLFAATRRDVLGIPYITN